MPNNRKNNSPLAIVEGQGSKEFDLSDGDLPVGVVHAVKVLEDYFKEQGYDQWILGPICSRKLLEKVQQRVPNPTYRTVAAEATRVLQHDGPVLNHPHWRHVGTGTVLMPAVFGQLAPQGPLLNQVEPMSAQEMQQMEQHMQERLARTQNAASEVHAQAVEQAIESREQDTPF